jgi:hypothetical protein
MVLLPCRLGLVEGYPDALAGKEGAAAARQLKESVGLLIHPEAVMERTPGRSKAPGLIWLQ